MERHNIYFVVSHPIQYFTPLYKHLAEEENVQVNVFYLSQQTLKGSEDKQFGVKFTWDLPLLEGYTHSFLTNYSWRYKSPRGFWGYINPGLIGSLWRKPKGLLIISGWNSLSEILGFVFGKLFGHTVCIRCDAPVFKEVHRSGFKTKIRKFILGKILFNMFVDKFLYLGTQNRAFYKYFDVPDGGLVHTPFSVDNHRFASSITSLDKSTERNHLHIPTDAFVILFTGKLIDIKRPLDLVRAYHQLEIPNKYLLFVGEGMLRNTLELYVKQNEVKGVKFAGFVNQSLIPNYYLVSDVLVLCSESETWGLSINEGMACGLPVVISDAVGCGEDLVVPGRNGFIYPKGDVIALKDSLMAVHQQLVSGKEMGKESLKIIERYSIRETANGILLAAQQASTHNSKSEVLD